MSQKVIINTALIFFSITLIWVEIFMSYLSKLSCSLLQFLFHEAGLSPKTWCVAHWAPIYEHVILIFILFYARGSNLLSCWKYLFILKNRVFCNIRIALFRKILMNILIMVKYSSSPWCCPLQNLNIRHLNWRFRLYMWDWRKNRMKLFTVSLTNIWRWIIISNQMRLTDWCRHHLLIIEIIILFHHLSQIASLPLLYFCIRLIFWLWLVSMGLRYLWSQVHSD